ncbi:MAG: 30S ribosomal protein S15 [Elusimicrobiales bacterium]
MAITKEQKLKIIERFAKNIKDCGNSAVQIAILTERINYLSNHISSNPKDFSAKRTLSILISKRKSLINFLKKNNPQEYSRISREIGLRK